MRLGPRRTACLPVAIAPDESQFCKKVAAMNTKEKFIKASKLVANAADPANTEHQVRAFAEKAKLFLESIRPEELGSFASDRALIDEQGRLESELQTEQEKTQKLFRQAYQLASEVTSLKNEVAQLKRKLLHSEEELARRTTVEVARIDEVPSTSDADKSTRRHDQPASSTTAIEYVPVAELSDRARGMIGRHWKAALAFRLQITLKEMAAWQTVGIVPTAFCSAFESMTENDCAPASRQRWTVQEYQRLAELVGEEKSNLEIAQILTHDFRRRLYESSIVGARRRMRALASGASQA